MLNQGQGTYPQLAGSFYNSAQMTPHDNGRNAHQVPTFFGGLQNMMSASTAMQNYQGMPLNQNILQTQSAAYTQYGTSLANTVGHIGTGLGIGGLLGGFGMLGAGGLAALMGAPATIAGLGIMGATTAYNRRMAAVEDVRNALQGSRLGYGLADPITGNIGNQAALQLSRQISHSAYGAGFESSDLKKLMGQASGLGMLNGMQSLGEVTKRVTDLAKASREIVALGEGITMSDAMQLQKLTQDMGISTSKFRGMNIGKNLVMAARASSMSMDQAAQLGGMGAMTFQQVGLGAASGMNAAFFTNIAARGLTGAGAFSPRELSALGGQQGIAQHLLSGQASTMARMSDTLVMGSVKLGQDGQFRIDRDMLDRYVRGDITAEEMRDRAKNIGRGMSKGRRAQLLEGLQYAMPQLKEQMSDMLSPEEIMAIQGREILELRGRNPGLSMRRAAQAYFGDQAQAETFLGYAGNLQATRAEASRQRRIADQEQTLRYAGMAKSSSALAHAGRFVSDLGSGAIDLAYGLVAPFGEGMADTVMRMQDARERGMRRLMGIGAYGGEDIGDIGNRVFLRGRRRGSRSILRGNYARRSNQVAGVYSSYEDMINTYYDANNEQALLDRFDMSSGLNEFLGGGLEDRLRDYEEGERFFLRDINFGIDNFSQSRRKERLLKAARVAADARSMGRVISSNRFNARNMEHLRAFDIAMDSIRESSAAAAKGEGTGFLGGVDSSDIGYANLRGILASAGIKDPAVIDAALGEAYRYSKSAGGDLSKGFNLMLDRTAKAGSMELLTQPLAGERDTLSFSGGTLYAKGLSRALAESEIEATDVNKLIQAFANQRKRIEGEGAGRDSLAAILRLAGIDPGKYKGRTHGLMAVIDSLRGARVRSRSGDKEVEQTLEEAANSRVLSRSDIRNLVSSDSINRAVDADTLRRQQALDAEIGLSLGEGGQDLRKDLMGIVSDEDPVRAANLAFLRDKFSKQARIDVMTKQQLQLMGMAESKEELSYGRELEAVEKRLQENKARMEATSRDRHGSRHTPEHMRLQEKHAKLIREHSKVFMLQEKARKIRMAKHRDNLAAAEKPDSELFQEARERLLGRMAEQELVNMTPQERAQAQEEYYSDKTTLLADSGTLQERLMQLAGDDKKKQKAYTSLMESSVGAELEQRFRALRADAAGADPSKMQGFELKATQMILEAAKGQKIAMPGQDESKSLPKILGEIAGGIKDFRAAMQHIATITAGKSVKIMGPVTATAEEQ